MIKIQPPNQNVSDTDPQRAGAHRGRRIALYERYIRVHTLFPQTFAPLTLTGKALDILSDSGWQLLRVF